MPGLITDDSKYSSLVLKSLSLFVNSNGYVATTLATLHYINQFDHDVKAVFVYDDRQTFVTDFKATINQRDLFTKVVENSYLNERFSSVDETGYLVIAIGEIPARARIMLEVRVVGELETAENGRAWVYKTPETFTPPYCSEQTKTREESEFHLKIKSNLPCQLAGCFSPSHSIQADADVDAMNANTIIITLAQDYEHDGVIEVYFYPAKPFDIFASIEQGHSSQKRHNDLMIPSYYSAANTRHESTRCRNVKALRTHEEFNDSPVIRTREDCGKLTESRSNDGVLQKLRSRSLPIYNEMKTENYINDEIDCIEGNLSRLHDKRSVVISSHLDSSFRDSENNVMSAENWLQELERRNCKIVQVYLRETTNNTRNEHEHYDERLTNHLLYNSRTMLKDNNLLQDMFNRDKKEHIVNNGLFRGRDAEEVKKSLNDFREDWMVSNYKHERHSRDETEYEDFPKLNGFQDESILATSFIASLSSYQVCAEFIFVLDRSGSMKGSFLSNAKQSLFLFLKSLPTSSYFNIISFGSYTRSLFPSGQRYTPDNLEKACAHVHSFQADMGGSQLLTPLKAVLETPEKAGYVRNVFVLTDGDVTEPETILDYLNTKLQGSKTRIFTFGIGPKITHHTVRNIAKFGKGKAFFSEGGEKLQTQVVQCLKEILKPALCDVAVHWELPQSFWLKQSTPAIPCIVSGQRIILYAAVQSSTGDQPRLAEKGRSSIVKEFWFDEELDSCQLEDFHDVRTSSGATDYGEYCEVTPSQSGRQDLGRKWRETCQLYSSDTSTETDDELPNVDPITCFPGDNIRHSPPERDLFGINEKMYRHLYETDDMTTRLSCTNTFEFDGIVVNHNQPDGLKMNMRETLNNNKTGSSKNVDDACYANESSATNFEEHGSNLEDDCDSNCSWGSVFITGYIGSEVYQNRLMIPSKPNTCSGVSMHSVAAKMFLDNFERVFHDMPGNLQLQNDIITLSKESRVLSSMTSLITLDESGNVIGVSTGRSATVDQGSLSNCKRGLGMTSHRPHDGRKNNRISREDPEGCDQVLHEPSRMRLAESRFTPKTQVRRHKDINPRLVLLSRHMRNAGKLNIFAGPPYIRLVLLQSSEGFWQLTYAFARVIGLPLAQLELAAPFVDSTMIPLAEQDDRLGIDRYQDSLTLWATALALVYLDMKWSNVDKEWQLLAGKAEAWLQTQKFPAGFHPLDVMLAAKQAVVLLEQKNRSRANSEPIVKIG